MRRILCAFVPLVLLTGCADAAAPTAPTSTGTTPASAATSNGPDVAPHEADNNGWKQRRDLTDADRAAGERAAALIRPALQRQRAVHDFALDSTRRTLVAIGFAATSIQVEPLHDGSAGAVFAVRTGQACVIGDIRPERVLVQTEGAAAEFGCLAPFSH